MARNVVEETTGPHKTVYEGGRSVEAVDPLLIFKKQLRKYIPKHLTAW